MTLKIKSFFAKNEFVQNVCILMSGTVLSQIVSVLSIPLLTRLYQPDDFGSFAVFVSLASVLSICICGRYELAIILVKERSEGINLIVLCAVISVCISIILFTLISLYCFFYFPYGSDMGTWLFFLPLHLMFTGMYQALYMWFNKENNYIVMARANMIYSILCSLLGIALSFFVSNGMIIAVVFSQAVTMTYLSLLFLAKEKANLHIISLNNMCELKNKYIKFPKFMIFGNVVDALAVQAPTLLLNMFYGSVIVGYYSLAYRCMSMPMGLISKSLGEAFRQKAMMVYQEKGSCFALYDKMLRYLTKCSVIFAVLLFATSHEIFSLLFGDEWSTSGKYVQILAIAFSLQLVSSPLTNMFILGQQQRQYVLLQIAYLFFAVSSLSIGYYLFADEILSLVLYGFSFAFLHLFNIYLSRKIAKRTNL